MREALDNLYEGMNIISASIYVTFRLVSSSEWVKRRENDKEIYGDVVPVYTCGSLE